MTIAEIPNALESRLLVEQLHILRQVQPMMPARGPVDSLGLGEIRIGEGADAHADFRSTLFQTDDRVPASRTEDIVEPAAGIAMVTPDLPLALERNGIGREDRLIAVA